ncbi:MAG: hypothetical protein GX766_09915 [Firmicutes bacterium]|nr:hypothetical protein [Bacillota bacterium]
MRKKRVKKDNRDFFRALRLFGDVGFTLAGGMLGGFFLGRLIDNLLGTTPCFAAGGFVLGAIVGFIRLWHLAMEEVGR